MCAHCIMKCVKIHTFVCVDIDIRCYGHIKVKTRGYKKKQTHNTNVSEPSESTATKSDMKNEWPENRLEQELGISMCTMWYSNNVHTHTWVKLKTGINHTHLHTFTSVASERVHIDLSLANQLPTYSLPKHIIHTCYTNTHADGCLLLLLQRAPVF